jgi:hypothetical protein
MRIGIRNNAFFLANLRICDYELGHQENFAICGLIIINLQIRTHQNLQTCDCGVSPRIADLRLAF